MNARLARMCIFVPVNGDPDRHDRTPRDDPQRPVLAAGRPPTQQQPTARSVGSVGCALDRFFSPSDSNWVLHGGYEPALEHEVESRFTVSNGLLGTNGSLACRQRGSRPRSYVAGFFGAGPGSAPLRRLIPGPDWSCLEIALDGDEVEDGAILAIVRVLDLRRGLLLTQWEQRGSSGAVAQIRALRLASLARRSLGLQAVQIDVSARTVIGLEARVGGELSSSAGAQGEGGVTVLEAEGSQTRLVLAVDCELRAGGCAIAPGEERDARRHWRHEVEPGAPLTFTRLIEVMRDGNATDDRIERARSSLRAAREAGPARLIADHVRAWDERWRACDVVVRGDHEAQMGLRFALYHLISAANPESERTSIGARALTGPAYLGHVFWDTDIFLLPFYVFTWPAAARALLMYRHRTLAGARAKAAALGFRGALYAWESADTGEDVTPKSALREDGRLVKIRCGTDEQHISADVAHAVWQYWDATHDEQFLLDAGAEIMIETARFWASRAVLEDDGHYHIRGVIGPDEYHEVVDDNAYTNFMARWNLERAREVAGLLAGRWPERWAALRQGLGIAETELAEWDDVARRLALLQDPVSGMIEQFAGFFRLQDVDLRAYRAREAPLDVLLGHERVQASQVVKQADVVMLLALQWERFSPVARGANFAYYEPRCGHGSSLSPPIHALVAARLGDPELALRYFRETTAIDLDDSMGNAAGGVHIGAQGGLWQAVVFGFAGLSFAGDVVVLAPHLPQAWEGLSFLIQWRGAGLKVSIDRTPLAVAMQHVSGDAPTTVRLGDAERLLAGRQTLRFTFSGGAWLEDPT